MLTANNAYDILIEIGKSFSVSSNLKQFNDSFNGNPITTYAQLIEFLSSGQHNFATIYTDMGQGVYLSVLYATPNSFTTTENECKITFTSLVTKNVEFEIAFGGN